MACQIFPADNLDTAEMATVTIACHVPNGLVIGSDEFGRVVKLNGYSPHITNLGNITTLSLTEVDADVWNAWAANAGAAFVAAGAVWQVS
jgi:hypothetical protein